MSFDPKCLDLAVHFLGAGAYPEALREMAQAIQDAVEANMTSEELPDCVWRDAATPFAENH